MSKLLFLRIVLFCVVHFLVFVPFTFFSSFYSDSAIFSMLPFPSNLLSSSLFQQYSLFFSLLSSCSWIFFLLLWSSQKLFCLALNNLSYSTMVYRPVNLFSFLVKHILLLFTGPRYSIVNIYMFNNKISTRAHVYIYEVYTWTNKNNLRNIELIYRHRIHSHILHILVSLSIYV